MKKLFLTLIVSVFTFSTINAQKIEIKKSFGSYMFSQNDKNLTVSQLTEIMKNNTEAYELMKSAKTNNTWASVLGFSGGFLVGFPIGTAIGGGDAKWELAAAGAGLILVAIPLNNAFKKKSKKAVELYNSGISDVSSNFKPQLHFNFKGANIGISMNF